MMMNTENKKISQSRKRRIERKIKMDDNDKMKSKLKKFKSEKTNKNNKGTKDLETELIKIKYANNPNKLQNAL